MQGAPGQKNHPKLWRLRRLLMGLLFVLVVLYISLGSLIWWAMHQSPEKFGRVMAKIPGPVVFLLFPFETLWTHARAGTLKVGDPTPDFSLLKVDKSGPLRLSEVNKKQPMVLVFGSYT